jgi:purine nucleoside permease
MMISSTKLTAATLAILWFNLLVVASAASHEQSNEQSHKQSAVPIKVVVVTMYENGEHTGDRAGELQLWVERLKGLQSLPFPVGQHDLYLNADGVLVICTGGGIPNATASIMALGLDARFDLSDAYWLIAGIAGGDPADVSIGSGVWARHVVDGDLAYEIDAREMPAEWPYGFMPLGGYEPAEPGDDVSTGWTVDTVTFALNEPLVDWAYTLTKDIALPSYAATNEFARMFTRHPNASKPAFVTRGEHLSASTYWHGEELNKWANDWVQVYSSADRNFMTSGMEDSGTLTALHRLGRIDKVDPERVLVLRTVSNFTVPPAGKSVMWSATADYPDNGLPALESAYRIGSKVVQQLVDNWAQYQQTIPGE